MKPDDSKPISEQTIAHVTDGGAEFRMDLSRPRYALDRLHAAGGIGEIWLARDGHLDREVALKRLQAQAPPTEQTKVRFLREARITGQLDHPGVVPVYEICIDDVTGLPYYTMRFLKGRTLTEAVRQYHRERAESGSQVKGLLGLLSAFDIVCNTVAYAHAKGIIHRDLKCDNVILGDYGEVVVIDWGLAKEYGRSDAGLASGEQDLESVEPTATIAGHILGTPAYMAPEQAAGDVAAIGPATDVYGLSAILYEILCGQAPFRGRNTIEVLNKVQREAPTRPSEIVAGIPEPLEQICLKGLSKAPGDRPSSAAELAASIQTWVSELAERRQAEEERERFFALSQDLLAILDADLRLRQVSPAWRTLLGFEQGELIDRSFLEFMGDDDRPRVERSLRSAQPDALQAKTRSRDGGYRWISWNVTPIAAERALYLVGRDVTELKRSQELFEGILKSAPDALILIDTTGRITLANLQAEHIFGYSQSELLGQPIEMLIPHRFRERHPEHVVRFFAESSFRPMGSGLALRGLRKNGEEFAVEVSLSPIAVETGRLVAASVRDMSNQATPH